MEDPQQYRGNILVVDDTPANLRLLVNLLSEKGYKVRALPSGKLALAGIHVAPPDLILLDIMMPDMDGYEVCQKLKSHRETQDIPIIFLSAINEVIDKVKAFSIGAVDYITKPFQIEEVIARVETHLEHRFLQEKLQQKNEELAQTLAELQTAQEYIIKSEKMAALGQLVASIAHEINTPLGAIRASSSNSATALDEFLTAFPQLLQQFSSYALKDDFLKLLTRSLQKESSFSPKEKRQFKRDLIQQLRKHEIQNSRKIADILVDINIYDQIDPFISLFKDPDIDWILQLIYNLSRMQTNNQNVIHGVERVSKVVLALKRYTHYDQSGEKQLIQVTDSLETVLELYHNQFKQGIKVIQAYQPVPEIQCYPDELNQVWTNLIHNAIQAMEGQGTLKLSVDQQQENVMIEITDTGCGIPQELQDKIFEPFFTTKPMGEGSGLGLDIVQKIIQKHQGKIEVQSQPGQTTFYVLLPIQSD